MSSGIAFMRRRSLISEKGMSISRIVVANARFQTNKMGCPHSFAHLLFWWAVLAVSPIHAYDLTLNNAPALRPDNQTKSSKSNISSTMCSKKVKKARLCRLDPPPAFCRSVRLAEPATVFRTAADGNSLREARTASLHWMSRKYRTISDSPCLSATWRGVTPCVDRADTSAPCAVLHEQL